MEKRSCQLNARVMAQLSASESGRWRVNKQKEPERHARDENEGGKYSYYKPQRRVESIGRNIRSGAQ